jgi:hypothetical protein
MSDVDTAAQEPERTLTRRELAEELAKSRELNARMLERLDALEAKQATPTLSVQETILQKELAAATKELADKRLLLEKYSQRQSAGSPDIPLVPYEGYVIATATCAMDTRHEEGEIFYVSVPALYTDDPYEPVTILEQDVEGTPTKWEKNRAAPTPINFRFRKVVSAAEDPTPRRANEY